MTTLEEFAVWSTAYVNDLPDSAFLYIESGGSKDGDGKTTPRSLRHFPVRDANGKVDLPHVRNALAQIPKSNVSADAKKAAIAKAQKLLNDNDGDESARVADEFFTAVVPLTHVDVRDPSANEDNTWTMSGYAAVFNQQAVFMDSKWQKLTVDIAPDAFARVFQEQPMDRPEGAVHFNIGHDMNRAVAATNIPAGQPGSLQLRADAHGLKYHAKVSRDDPDAVAMATKMRDGVFGQASMAFVAANNEFTSTEEGEKELVHRRILEVGTLYDVCTTPQGMFPQTVSQLQQYAKSLGQPSVRPHIYMDGEKLGGHQGQPDSSGGSNPVSPVVSGGGADRRREIARYQRDLARIRK